MSKHRAALALARGLLDRAEPLLADLPNTLERWGRYRGMRRPDAYFARLGTSDRDLDDVGPADTLTVDVMARRVSSEYPAWSSLRPDAVPQIGAAGFERLLATVASHPDGYVREAATRVLAESGRRPATSLVLRCLDPVPAVRSVAAARIVDLLEHDPMDLSRTDYDLLRRPRARRLVPELAATAARVQATSYYVRRRDRESVDLLAVVGADALVEAADVPANRRTTVLGALSDAGIAVTPVEVPIAVEDGAVFRTTVLVRAADEPRATEVIEGTMRRRLAD